MSAPDAPPALSGEIWRSPEAPWFAVRRDECGTRPIAWRDGNWYTAFGDSGRVIMVAWADAKATTLATVVAAGRAVVEARNAGPGAREAMHDAITALARVISEVDP